MHVLFDVRGASDPLESGGSGFHWPSGCKHWPGHGISLQTVCDQSANRTEQDESMLGMGWNRCFYIPLSSFYLSDPYLKCSLAAGLHIVFVILAH